MTDKEELKKIIDLAVDVIKDVPSNLQNTALELVLQKLLISDVGDLTEVQNSLQPSPSGTSVTPKEKLADLCGIPKEELDNVILEKDGHLEILCSISGVESFKMIIGSLIILGSHEILFDKVCLKNHYHQCFQNHHILR